MGFVSSLILLLSHLIKLVMQLYKNGSIVTQKTKPETSSPVFLWSFGNYSCVLLPYASLARPFIVGPWPVCTHNSLGLRFAETALHVRPLCLTVRCEAYCLLLSQCNVKPAAY